MTPTAEGGPRESLSTEGVLQAMEQRFALRREVSVAPSRPPDTQAYQLAAAVLHVFDPRELRPFGEASDAPAPIGAILSDSVPAVGWRQQRLRSLRLDVRRPLLADLGSRDAMRKALAANPGRVLTPLQALFEQWIDGQPIEPERLRYSQLECLRQLYEWGLDRLGGLPDAGRLEAARTRRTTTSVFEHLVDDDFVGRESELQELRDYVGVVSPSNWARLRSFLTAAPKPPIVVAGPGGAGKTALVGKFLLEHVESSAAGWFPFAYLPFDSDTLDVREPFTLLIAAASQLGAQVGHADSAEPTSGPLGSAFGAFREVVAGYRDRRGALGQRAGAFGSQGQRLEGLRSADDELYASFASLLTAIAAAAAREQGAEQVPVLLVFDTFEEVLYRSREHLIGFWKMLASVQRGFPRLRVVMASRAEPRPVKINGRTPLRLTLGDLRENDAMRLLGRLGVSEPGVAHAIVQQIGRNPLTLRLAARVAREEAVGRGGIRSLETRRYLVLSVAPELVRGQLYRRILDHIHDPDVRVLAHPGMVLRRMTPDIISAVLAPACALGDMSGTRAHKLFDELRREHSLVSLEQDGSLQYREEVRRPMLQLLARDKPEQVRLLHRAAAEYYEARTRAAESPDPSECAETIYHRLMLGEDGSALERAWIQGAERYLGSAIEELPPAQRVWLAQHMDIELPSEIRKLADLATWERIAGRKALEAFRHEGPAAVLEILAERKERTPSSPLDAIECRCLLALGRAQDALAASDAAIQRYPAMGNPGRLAELLWIRSQAELMLSRADQAADTLRRLAELGSSLSCRLARVQALTELVEVERTLDAPELPATRNALATELSHLSESEVDDERSLVRLALTRLGPGYSTTASGLIPLVISDLVYVVQQRRVDLPSILAGVSERLQQSGRPGLNRLAREVARSDTNEHAVGAFMNLLERLARRRGKIDHHAIEAVLQLMSADGASLRGATLAGLDAYREPWELLATPEVAA